MADKVLIGVAASGAIEAAPIYAKDYGAYLATAFVNLSNSSIQEVYVEHQVPGNLQGMSIHLKD